MKSEPGPPMTLGNAAAAQVRFIVWCKACRHQVEPATASVRAAEGGTVPISSKWRDDAAPRLLFPEWHKRLVCSRCGSHDTDMVVTGERR